MTNGAGGPLAVRRLSGLGLLSVAVSGLGSGFTTPPSGTTDGDVSTGGRVGDGAWVGPPPLMFGVGVAVGASVGTGDTT
jgi:hypothetical protein